MSVILFVLGIVLTIYSPWFQDRITPAVITYLNNQNDGMHYELSRFRLNFPLEIEFDDFVMQDTLSGDTLVKAMRFRGDLGYKELANGHVEVKRAQLDDGRYQMGTRDSSLYLVAQLRYVDIHPADVSIDEGIDIDLKNVTLEGGQVTIALNPDTTTTEKQDSAQMLKIRVQNAKFKDFGYSMSMMPTIDSLGMHINEAELHGGLIDLAEQTVDIKSFTGTGMDVKYLMPDSAALAAYHAPQVNDSTESKPWTVNVQTIQFTDSKALYTTRGYKPLPGMDFGYIQVDSLDFYVSDFYNCATDVKIPIRQLKGIERSGVKISQASGDVIVNDSTLTLDNFELLTPNTALSANVLLGMGDLMTDETVPISLTGSGQVGAKDIALMFPDMSAMLNTFPGSTPVEVDMAVAGTMGKLNISKAKVQINKCISLTANGTVNHVMDMDRIGGNLALKGSITGGNRIKNAFLDASTASEINIPPMTLDGNVKMNSGNIAGNLKAVTKGGTLAMKADWQSRREIYSLDLNTKKFPVDAFMPSLGIGNATINASVNGKGYDFFSRKTVLNADVDVVEATNNDVLYTDVRGKVTLAEGIADIDFSAVNEDVDFDLAAHGNLYGDTYIWNANIDMQRVDLLALKFAETTMTVSGDIAAEMELDPKTRDLAAKLNIASLDIATENGMVNITDVVARVNANDSLTNISLRNKDLYTYFSSESPLDSVVTKFSSAMDVVNEMMTNKRVTVSKLQSSLPEFTMDVTAGSDNLLTHVLADSDMGFKRLNIDASNDSLININARAIRVNSGTTVLDTVDVKLYQEGDVLYLKSNINNKRGTFDDFAHVAVDGYIADTRAGFMMTQKNIDNEVGFHVGAMADIDGSTVNLTLVPDNPTIGYKEWTINEDNFVFYNFDTMHLDADVRMQSAKSYVQLYTEHDGNSEGSEEEQEDVIVKIGDVAISDWLSFNPFAPPLKGDLSADMRFNWDKNTTTVVGKGSVTLDELYYGKERVGSFLADVDVTTDSKGMVRATAELSVDNVRTITVSGALNDSSSSSPFNLDFSMIQFPLKVVNPFLPTGTASLSGILNGKMDISGDADNPIFNGWIDFDSAAVKVNMTGTAYKFSEVSIPVKNNVVEFNNFTISGVNANPLYVNGKVDASNMMSPSYDLTMKANNMQIVNTTRALKGADVYGKAFIDLDAKVKGNMRFMNLDASLAILPTTNVTYVMTDAQSAITSQSTGDMVHFVQFSDSMAVTHDSIDNSSMVIMANALLDIKEGSTINVDLATDGKVQLQADGKLNYTQAPMSDGRLTGRININKGYVKYSPPVLGEKLFNFQEGSYVAFNGEMMNPTLNIHAIDEVKTNVTQEGQNSRLVNFDVALNVTGTLNTMNVAFDLSTDDDITVANELQTMSAEQRSNQAMNLLLYNVYSGQGTSTATGNIGSNALFSFLESQVNTWAAQNIKGVDLSFGIDQYSTTTDGSKSTATSYSYKVSKSLFNDRFKIVVGGNYSTDADTDENLSQNLINDISFEYYLNDAGTMYFKLFRHTGYESILEGEITQTGAGFVYKRKIGTLLDLFRPYKRKVTISLPQEGAVVQ
jgi:hypothetical protein